MFRPTKRQRLEHPTCWMDCESIETIPSPLEQQFILKTPVATMLTKEIFFDRFQKEILQPFGYNLSSQVQVLQGDSLSDVKARRSLLQERIICGINAVTRILEAALVNSNSSSKHQTVPLLLVLTTDVYPSVTAHLPILAQQVRVPVLLLPGVQSSRELGKLLGTKNVAAVAFVQQSSINDKMTSDEERRVHAAVDSLANFVRGKIESK